MRRMWIAEYTALSLAFSASLVAAPGEGAIGKVTDIPDTAARSVSQAASVCASAAGSRIILDSGSNIWLAPGARGTFYRDRLELESGGVSMRLSSGFEVRVNDITFRADGASSAAILMIDSGHTALAVRAGTIRVASNGVVIAPAVRVGQSLEFAMAQSPSSGGGTTGPGGNGNRNGNPATGNCSCTFCVEGTISIVAPVKSSLM